MKEYRGYFRSCDTSVDERGQLFMVQIISSYIDKNTITKEDITLTDEPFTVEYEGDETIIQKPYKCSTATAEFLLNTFRTDLYNTNQNNVLVKLSRWKNNNTYTVVGSSKVWTYSYSTPLGEYITGTYTDYFGEDYPNNANLWDTVWVGFATPNTYSQAFEGVFDSVSINAQDALSTLKYIDYSSVDTKVGFVSFSDIIKKYVKQLGVYNYIYVTDAIKTQIVEQQDILHSLYIDERNFFDEDNKPMKVLEVIEHICNYLNLTAIPYGDSLYFINYDAIKNGENNYFIWYLNNDEFIMNSAPLTLESDHIVQMNDFAEDGTNMSVLDAFNKVTIKDDMYPIESIIPDIEDENNWVKSEKIDSTVFGPNMLTIDYTSKTFNSMNYSHQNPRQRIFIQWLGYSETTPFSTIKTSWYPIDTAELNPSGHWALVPNYTKNTSVNTDKLWSYETSQSNVGCCLIRYSSNKYHTSKEEINKWNPSMAFAIVQPIPDNYREEVPKREGCWLWYDTENRYLPPYMPTQEVLDITTDNVQLSEDMSIDISGNFEFFPDMYTIPIQYENTDPKAFEEWCYEWASLQVGGSWWNGESWQNNRCGFKLPIQYEKDKNAFNTDYAITSNILSSNDKKYSVAVPILFNNNVSVITSISFKLYRTICPRFAYLSPLTLLKDFNITLSSSKTKVMINALDYINTEDNTKDNIEYSLKLNSVAQEEYPDIENKITTWNFVNPNYSSTLLSPLFYENGYINIVRKEFLKNKTIYNKGTNSILLAEDHKIQSIQDQYKKATITIDMSLKESLQIKPWTTLHYHYFDDVVFVIDSSSYDYRWNKQTIKLFEKV